MEEGMIKSNLSSSWLGGVSLHLETMLATSMDLSKAINVTSSIIEPIVSDVNSTLAAGNEAAVSELEGTTTPDYEYEIEDSLENYDWGELIPTVIVYSFVLLLGISGNALIIFTIARYRRLKTITNIFLASLASADLLLVTICVPVNVAKLFSYTWTFGAFLCKFVHYMQNVSAICSVLTLTAMSIERYYAIVHPMRAQYLCTLSQARKVITATWIASLVLAMPTLWIQIHLPVGERVPAYWCVRDWENPLNWQIYELYMLVLVLVLPLAIMAGAYAAIGREIWRVTYLRSAMINEPNIEMNAATAVAVSVAAATASAAAAPSASNSGLTHDNSAGIQLPADLPDVIEQSEVGINQPSFNSSMIAKEPHNRKEGLLKRSVLNTSSNQQNSVVVGWRESAHRHGSTISYRAPPPASQRAQADHRTARQVVKMLVAVVVLFAVCWAPYLIDNVLMSFELLPGARTGPKKHMRIAFHLLSYINSCCNPLVYGFMSRNFRRGFKAALRLRAQGCYPYFCYCPTCCHRHHARNVRQRSVYKFSQVSRNSRISTQIRLQDPGYVRASSVAGFTNTSIVGAGSIM